LIERGASIYDVTTEKKNVLHFAAMAGRAENIKVLLAAGGPMLLKVRDKTNMSPMAYACRLGEI
jgi:ankyrin repeat protein